MAPRARKSLGINIERNTSDVDKIPASKRAEYKAKNALLEMFAERLHLLESKPELATPRDRAKLSRAYFEILQSPPETFLDFDPYDYNPKQLVEKINTLGRRVIDSAVLDTRPGAQGGQTGHHKAAVMAGSNPMKQLTAYEIYDAETNAAKQGTPLGSQNANVDAIPGFVHKGDGLTPEQKEGLKIAHPGGDTTNKRLLGKIQEFGPDQGKEALSYILDNALKQHQASDAAWSSDEHRAYQAQLENSLRSTEEGSKLVDAIGKPLKDIRNWAPHEDVKKFYKALQVKPNYKEILDSVGNAQRIQQLAQITKNPAASRALGLVPFLGTGIGAATVELNQKNRDKEIAENPNDFSLKINKTLDWWSGWGDRATAVGAGLTASGIGAPVGVPMMAAGEAVSSAAGLTSLGIDAGRAAIKATNNRGPRTNWNDRLKARRGVR